MSLAILTGPACLQGHMTVNEGQRSAFCVLGIGLVVRHGDREDNLLVVSWSDFTVRKIVCLKYKQVISFATQNDC